MVGREGMVEGEAKAAAGMGEEEATTAAWDRERSE